MTDEHPDAQTRRVLTDQGLPAGLLPPGIVGIPEKGGLTRR